MAKPKYFQSDFITTEKEYTRKCDTCDEEHEEFDEEGNEITECQEENCDGDVVEFAHTEDEHCTICGDELLFQNDVYELRHGKVYICHVCMDGLNEDRNDYKEEEDDEEEVTDVNNETNDNNEQHEIKFKFIIKMN